MYLLSNGRRARLFRNNNGFSRMHGDEKCMFGYSWEKKFVHHTKLKAPKKLYEGERSIRSFLAIEPRLALAGAKKCVALMRGRDGGRPRAQGKIRWEKFAHLPPILPRIYTSPPKVLPPFSSFRALRLAGHKGKGRTLLKPVDLRRGSSSSYAWPICGRLPPHGLIVKSL
jgi:hypothetical protein